MLSYLFTPCFGSSYTCIASFNYPSTDISIRRFIRLLKYSSQDVMFHIYVLALDITPVPITLSLSTVVLNSRDR